MNLFRQALNDAAANSALVDGDRIYLRPAQQFVPIAWVEKMAEYEWECEETGMCNHPSTKKAGCYEGREVDGCWLCDALLKDNAILTRSPEEILQNLRTAR